MITQLVWNLDINFYHEWEPLPSKDLTGHEKMKLTRANHDYPIELTVLYDSIVLGPPTYCDYIQEGQGSPLERKTILI